MPVLCQEYDSCYSFIDVFELLTLNLEFLLKTVFCNFKIHQFNIP